MSNVTVLVGAQWGDEGKGKWIDILSENADIIVRYQGGNNAGHTLYVAGEKIVLHQIPSGIFQQDKICALSSGVVINPSELVKEIEKVSKLVSVSSQRLWLSPRAHMITPWHIYLDSKKEGEVDQPIGTTKRGIGPTYAEKANRSGLRLGDFVQDDRRSRWIEQMKSYASGFANHYEQNQELWTAFNEAASMLSVYVCDAEAQIRSAIERDKHILLEGAQGALLDINHGTYPYVTSSSTASAGALASIGFSPRAISKVIGVAKAYTTRVGEGPFPTEDKGANGKLLAEKGHEFGATTGRPRRCGWLDCVALKYSIDINGIDEVILNKMDILSGFDNLYVAKAYQHPTLGIIEYFPWDEQILSQCQPVYETLQGWSENLPPSGRIQDLPDAAKSYIRCIEAMIGKPIRMVGTGVNRNNALYAD